MLVLTLRNGDGLERGRPALAALVTRLQRGLEEAGQGLGVDGQFGSGTERALKAFQRGHGLPETGVADAATWGALGPFLARIYGARDALVAERMPTFGGDLDWVHAWESHAGHPYWPGGESGVTLDPGVDLGQVAFALVERLYGPLLAPGAVAALRGVAGLTGEAARRALEDSTEIRAIRISREQADGIMPVAAAPYWSGITRRFSALARPGTLASVHTVLLSLAYNRGYGNRHLEGLADPLAAGRWAEVADRVGRMQQDHRLAGIRRRRRYEAALIRAELEEQGA